MTNAVAVRRATLALLAALVLLQVADVITTHAALSYTAGHEANPIGGYLLTHGLLVWAKVAVVGLLALAAWRAGTRMSVLVASAFLVGIYTMIVLSNLLALRLLAGGA